jgi:hypothetical protein
MVPPETFSKCLGICHVGEAPATIAPVKLDPGSPKTRLYTPRAMKRRYVESQTDIQAGDRHFNFDDVSAISLVYRRFGGPERLDVT